MLFTSWIVALALACSLALAAPIRPANEIGAKLRLHRRVLPGIQDARNAAHVVEEAAAKAGNSLVPKLRTEGSSTIHLDQSPPSEKDWNKPWIPDPTDVVAHDEPVVSSRAPRQRTLYEKAVDKIAAKLPPVAWYRARGKVKNTVREGTIAEADLPWFKTASKREREQYSKLLYKKKLKPEFKEAGFLADPAAVSATMGKLEAGKMNKAERKALDHALDQEVEITHNDPHNDFRDQRIGKLKGDTTSRDLAGNIDSRNAELEKLAQQTNDETRALRARQAISLKKVAAANKARTAASDADLHNVWLAAKNAGESPGAPSLLEEAMKYATEGQKQQLKKFEEVSKGLNPGMNYWGPNQWRR